MTKEKDCLNDKALISSDIVKAILYASSHSVIAVVPIYHYSSPQPRSIKGIKKSAARASSVSSYALFCIKPTISVSNSA